MVGLGVTQTIGYGTLYYTLGVIAPAIAADIGVPVDRQFLWFSVALGCSALFAPGFGRWLDRRGARLTMSAGSLAAAAGLLGLACVEDELTFALAIGFSEILSALALYDAAFAAVTSIAGRDARRTITNITLFAGFASSIFWPVASLLLDAVGWRGVYLAFAGLNLAVCLPLHAFVLPRANARATSLAASEVRTPAPGGAAFWLLAVSFAMSACVVTAIPTQMVTMLSAAGFGAASLWLGSVMGPAQVAIRVFESTALRRWSALHVAMVAAAAPSIALLILLAGRPAIEAGVLFAIIFGVGSGLGSIVHGSLPLALFGPGGYGALLGRLSAVRLVFVAFAPFGFAAATERLGIALALAGALAFSAAGLLLLFALAPHHRKAQAALVSDTGKGAVQQG